MLTPDYLEHVADDIVELYQKLDEAIARDIARRLLKTGAITDTARWQAYVMQQSGLLFDDVVSEVAEIAGTSDAYVKRAFEQAGVESVDREITEYMLAGIDVPHIRMSEGALEILKADILKTVGQLKNLTLTTATATQQTFISACTLANMQVEQGAFDYNSAIKTAIKETSRSGASVLYPSGHSDKVDVAVRRAVLTGVNQTMCSVSLLYADEFDCDLMEITAHAGARPSHAVWQGQIVSRSGRRGYLTLSDIGYDTGAGFGGWNCRHSWNPYFEGISKRNYGDDALQKLNAKDIEYEGEKYTGYEISQLQRQMERDIRASKREITALDTSVKASAGNLQSSLKTEFDSASVRLKAKEAKLKDMLHETGNLPDNARVQVQGFGKSQAQKAVWAVKHNTLTNSAGQPIIKVNKASLHGSPNSITQVTNKKGGVDRNYYDKNGDQFKQISNNGHGHKKEEKLGEHGEHAHDYYWDENGKLSHGDARELTTKERKENGDVL